MADEVIDITEETIRHNIKESEEKVKQEAQKMIDTATELYQGNAVSEETLRDFARSALRIGAPDDADGKQIDNEYAKLVQKLLDNPVSSNLRNEGPGGNLQALHNPVRMVTWAIANNLQSKS